MSRNETGSPAAEGLGGEVKIVQPGEAESYWQPVPANGYVEVLFAPDKVAMAHPVCFGTQTVAPGCYVREHAHDKNEEVIFVFEGTGRAVVEGKRALSRC